MMLALSREGLVQLFASSQRLTNFIQPGTQMIQIWVSVFDSTGSYLIFLYLWGRAIQDPTRIWDVYKVSLTLNSRFDSQYHGAIEHSLSHHFQFGFSAPSGYLANSKQLMKQSRIICQVHFSVLPSLQDLVSSSGCCGNYLNLIFFPLPNPTSLPETFSAVCSWPLPSTWVSAIGIYATYNLATQCQASCRGLSKGMFMSNLLQNQWPSLIY